MTTLSFANGSLILRSRYDPSLVAGIKALPSTDRKYNPVDRTWLIAPVHGQVVADLVRQHLGETIVVPAMHALSKTETRMLEVRYIGAAKDRGGSERTALGWADNEWSVCFLESTLRDWFCAPKTPDQELTLYQVLAIKKDSDPSAIKTAYRRLSKQWHPDVCREPGASEIFRKINDAYSLLSDERKRARYDAGLALAATLTEETRVTPITDGYRSPLRCGLIMAEGQDKVGRFVVETILAWEDITNDRNQVLSVSWPIGAERFQEVWA